VNVAGLTADFVRAVPEDKWDFTPARRKGLIAHRYRIGSAMASRRFVSNCVMSFAFAVSTSRVDDKKVDWTRKHDHYDGLSGHSKAANEGHLKTGQ
jgi:hypothetical protein